MASKEFEMFVHQGDSFATSGKWDEAVEAYRKALRIEPQNTNVRRNIVNIYIRKAEFSQAIQEYLDWARSCQTAGALDEAIKVYQEILNLETAAEKKSFLMGQRGASGGQIKELINAAKGDIYYNLALILQEKGIFDESIQYLKVCLDMNPGDARLHTALGQAYMKKGMDKEAIGEFQEVVRLAPNEAAYAYEMLGEIFIRGGKPPQSTIVWFRNAGDLYIRNNQLGDAVRVYERILNFEPRNKEVLSRLGEIYAQKDSLEKAVACYKQLAQIYAEEGLLDKVIVLYERLVDWDPENVEVRDKVIEIYRRILQMDPSNLSARHKLIGNLLRRGLAEEAIPEFLSLASTYLERNMLDEGLSVCQKLLELDPSNLAANEILGQIYYKQGQSEAALDQFMHVVKILRERGDEEKANELSKKLVTLFPQQIELHYQQAIALRDRGNLEEALREFQVILKDNPEYILALMNSADILTKLGRWDDAYSVYLRILQIDPGHADTRKILMQHYLKTGQLARAQEEVVKLAEILMKKGDYKEIENIYRRILAYVPGDLKIRERLCLVQASRGHVEKAINGYLALMNMYVRTEALQEAISMVKRILELVPDNINARYKMGRLLASNPATVPEALGIYMSLAQIYLAKNLQEPALALLREILTIEPENVEYRGKLIELLVRQLKFEEATDHYKILMRVYLKDRKVAEARNVCKEISVLQPFNLDLRQDLSQIFLQENYLDEAQELFDELVQLYIDRGEVGKVIELYKKMAEVYKVQEKWQIYWDLREKIGDLYYRDGNIDRALEEYHGIIDSLLREEDFAREAKVYELVSSLYFKEEKIEQGIRSLERITRELFREGIMGAALVLQRQVEALYEQKGDWLKALEILRFMAYQFEEMGNLPEAMKMHERIAEIQLSQGDTDAAIEEYFVIIELYLRQKNLDSALQFFEKIQNWRRRDRELIFRMAELLFEKDYLDESRPLYQELLEMEPNHFEGMTRLAIIHASKGELAEAVNYAKKTFSKGRVAKIIEEYKKAVGAQEGLPGVHISIGLFYKEMGFVEEAIMEFQKASKDPVTELEAYDLLGLCFKEQGFVQLAIKQFQKALNETQYSDEDLQDIRYNLALTWEEMGNLSEALSMYQECYANDIRYKDVAQRIEILTEKLAEESGAKVIPIIPFFLDASQGG